MLRLRRRLLILVAAGALVVAGSAHLASNSVPASSVGQGAGAVTVVTVNGNPPTLSSPNFSLR